MCILFATSSDHFKVSGWKSQVTRRHGFEIGKRGIQWDPPLSLVKVVQTSNDEVSLGVGPPIVTQKGRGFPLFFGGRQIFGVFRSFSYFTVFFDPNYSTFFSLFVQFICTHPHGCVYKVFFLGPLNFRPKSIDFGLE